MIKKTLLLIILFLVSLLCFLIVSMPASVLWSRALAPNVDLRPYGVSVKALEGSLWDGRGLIEYQRVPLVVEWALDASALVALNVALDVRVKAHAGNAQAKAQVGMGQSSVILNSLDVDLSHLNSLVQRRRVTLDGNVIARDIELKFDGKRLLAAKGNASWEGGNIAYPVGRQTHERVMPPFKASLQTRDDGLVQLDVRDSEAGFPVIEGSLSPEGLALLQVRRRLLDLADEPANHDSERDVVFKVKKPLY